MRRKACLLLLFYSDLLQPGLDLFKCDLRTHAVSFFDITSTLGEFELFAAHLTDPTAQDAKTPYFNI